MLLSPNKKFIKLFPKIKLVIIIIAVATPIVIANMQVASATDYYVTNTNDSGAGSLRQAIINANASASTPHNIYFQIPETDSGFVDESNNHSNCMSGSNWNGTTPCAWRINLSSNLPAITRDNVIIDATIGPPNTNPGVMGAGGTVGTDGITLPQISKPEIMLVSSSSSQFIFQLQADGIQISGFSMYGMGDNSVSAEHAAIHISNLDSAIIENNVIGVTAFSLADPGSSNRSSGSGIYCDVNADNVYIQTNIIAYNGNSGIRARYPLASDTQCDNWTISNNEIRQNGLETDFLTPGGFVADGIDIENARNWQVNENLITQSGAYGIDMWRSGGIGSSIVATNNITNNTITSNGQGDSQPTNSLPELGGIRVGGEQNTINKNVLKDNFGMGILVLRDGISGAQPTVNQNIISQNSISNNQAGPEFGGSGLGIDLSGVSTTSEQNRLGDGISINDGQTSSGAGNLLEDTPIIISAELDSSSNNLVIKGYSRPGAQIELFKSSADTISTIGEGEFYLSTLTEGSPQDSNTQTGNYSHPVMGSDLNASQFTFSIDINTLPESISPQDKLVATSTIANNTSEFSPIAEVLGDSTSSNPQSEGSSTSASLAKTGTLLAIGAIFGSLIIVVAIIAYIYTYHDYKKHKTPLLYADPNVQYTYGHHLKYVSIPLFRYRLVMRLQKNPNFSKF